ncbi:PREDICTED: tripartite motif-containing protein 14 isoform X1 [Hipposideros armiger]|uniref:Tripartite motif-containing protein 14 isoform X1 n=1 Tax=Hipposideros armiger TaxID=186990 RepID=A0A8B7S0M0_HIPAR|nr:PREDICTED: tripartite motif-containing protein 14 isoform X1 [Hipposideros armiger]
MASAAAISRTPGGPGPAESEVACGWRCPEHGDRVAELFCRRCRRCVCALCPLLGSHRDHPVGLALDEAARVQKLTQQCLKQLEIKKQQEVGNRRQIEDAAEKLKAHAESSKIWLAGKFTELRLLLDEEESMVKKFVDKSTQHTLQVYREQIQACGEQIDLLNSLSNRVWSISQEPDPVQLLQEFTATEQEMKQQMTLGELCHPVPQSFEPIKSFFRGLTEAMQRTLQKPLDVRLKESRRNSMSQGPESEGRT